MYSPTIMKHFKFIASLLLATLVAGCDKSATSPEPTASQQLDQVKADTTQTAKDMKTYTYAEKDAFVKQMQTEMDELNVELTQLSAKIDKESDATKAAAQPKLDALKAQIADLGVDLDNAKSATETTWEKVQAGTQKGYDATKQAFVDAGAWIDKQM